MKIRNLAIFGATAASILWLWHRHQTLEEIRSDITTLHEQLRDGSPREAWSQAQSDSSLSKGAGMSDEEERELLHLRGLIRPLRQQIEVSSNSLMILSQPGIRPAPVTGRSQAPDAGARSQPVHDYMLSDSFRTGVKLGQALEEYLRQSDGKLPDDLNSLGSFDGSSKSGEFELIRQGPITATERAYRLVLREKKPFQSSDGKWVRIYVLGSGQAMLTSPSEQPDWPAIESSIEAIHKSQTDGANPSPP